MPHSSLCFFSRRWTVGCEDGRICARRGEHSGALQTPPQLRGSAPQVETLSLAMIWLSFGHWAWQGWSNANAAIVVLRNSFLLGRDEDEAALSPRSEPGPSAEPLRAARS